MESRIFSMISARPCNAASVTFGEIGADSRRGRNAACQRFLQAARQLPEGEFLGLQFAAERRAALVFSTSGVRAAREDYRWIFEPCSAAIGGEHAAPDFGIGHVYLLQPESDEDEGRSRRFREDEADREEAFSELLRGMEAGTVRFLAGQDGRSVIALCLPEELTLRMRTMLSIAFPNTSVLALEPDAQAELRGLPGEQTKDALTGLLSALMAKTEDQTEAAPSTPIEDLDLSVRAYNCLKRAGFSCAEELLPLTEEDLLRIRNLGRRGAEEISQKLETLRKAPDQTPPASGSSAAMLDELIGLENVKEQIGKITAFARMKRDLERQGRDAVPLALNMEFSGNPGTAKTTVARILAGIFCELGLLTGREPVEVGRADLVARYVGQTADQVKAIFDRADGRLLFIDEAYALAEHAKGEFGDEAINTIVQEMENRRNRTIVIFAGYPEQMEAFFSRNPGLRSRVPFRIVFSDYTAEEMVRIVELEAKKRGFSMGPDAREAVAALCSRAAGDPEKGNGRYCRNLAERAILEYASRVYSAEDASGDFLLTAEDFKQPEPEDAAPPERKIGFAA